jgi:hypothetical protein
MCGSGEVKPYQTVTQDNENAPGELVAGAHFRCRGCGGVLTVRIDYRAVSLSWSRRE